MQQLYSEMTVHLLTDERPSQFLNVLLSSGRLNDPPFSMLAALRDTPQSPVHHPEGSVWNHTCLVVDQAARLRGRSRNPAALLWAALLHDIGKPPTTRERRGKLTSYDHDKAGRELAREFLSALTDDQALIGQVCALVRWHMQPLFVAQQMPYADLPAMIREADVREVALLGYCDRMGRGGSGASEARAAVRLFLRKCGVDPDAAGL